jgi:hypothetical protein
MASRDARTLWPLAHCVPDQIILPIELDLLGDLQRKRACVLGGGDNLVTFALAGLGARVTAPAL